MTTIKKTISEMWEGTRESREGKMGLVLLTFISILAYAGVMALVYTIVGKPVFAVAYTNAFAATCVIFWRRRNSTAPMIKKQRIQTVECVMVPVITIVMTLGSTVLALWVKQSLNQPSPMQKLSETTPAIAIVIMSLIIAPIGEEALMRGFIYPVLRRKLSVTSTIVIAARKSRTDRSHNPTRYCPRVSVRENAQPPCVHQHAHAVQRHSIVATKYPCRKTGCCRSRAAHCHHTRSMDVHPAHPSKTHGGHADE